MALIVETGEGLVDAEAYASEAEATDYFSKRGQADAWDLVEDKEAALRLATDFLTQRFRGRWAGTQLTAEQALDWPRANVPWPDSRLGDRPYASIPRELKVASFEMALRTKDGPLVSDLGRETRSEMVDVISVTYAEGGSRQTEYAAVDMTVASLLRTGSNHSIPVSRA